MRCAKAICRVALGTLVVSSATLFASPMYMIQELPPVNGFYTSGYRLNNAGQVIGSELIGFPTATSSPFVSNETTMSLLPVPAGARDSSVGDINNSGQIIGVVVEPPGFIMIVRWDATTGQMTGTFSGQDGFPNALNDTGQATGGDNTFNSHATIWDSSSMQILATLNAFNYSYGSAINNLGQVVGVHGPNWSPFRSFFWDGPTVIDIGTLGGLSAIATGINDAGLVTGFSRDQSGWEKAFLWDGATMHNLGTLGGSWSSASAINRFGHITGSSAIESLFLTQHAFLWDGSGMIDLNTVLVNGDGWELLAGSDINDRGQITGFGYRNNEPRAFLLTPVSDIPEAGSAALTFAGIASILLLQVGRRRRQHRST